MGNDSDYFSKNYSEARNRFLRFENPIVRRGDRKTFKVPSRVDDDLFVDDLFVAPDGPPETLIALTSGVHGMEAAAGSALQLMFLEELSGRIDFRNTGLYMLHCFNPFGFKHGRRSTENNVNLNRGFAPDLSGFKVPNEGYDQIADWFETEDPVSTPLIPYLSTLKFVLTARLKGLNAASLNQAIAQGQFKHPRGLEYGGTDYEPQVRFFMDRFTAVAKGYKRILFFDLHTGIGEKDRLHLLTGSTPQSRNQKLLDLVLRPDEDSRLYEFTESHQPGFYRTVGDINTLIPTLTPEAEVLALTLEFATLGADLPARLEMLERLKLENQGFHAGYASLRAESSVKRKFRELFCPEEPKWRENTIRLGRETLKRVLLRSGSALA